MPIKECQTDGKKGYKWGSSGKCYIGADGKRKAIKQGKAIEASKNK